MTHLALRQHHLLYTLVPLFVGLSHLLLLVLLLLLDLLDVGVINLPLVVSREEFRRAVSANSLHNKVAGSIPD